MTTNSGSYAEESPDARPESIDEQVARKGIRPAGVSAMMAPLTF